MYQIFHIRKYNIQFLRMGTLYMNSNRKDRENSSSENKIFKHQINRT